MMLMHSLAAMAFLVSFMSSDQLYFSAVDEVHEGRVESVGEDTIIILDKRDDEVDKFVVNAETKITRNGKAVRLANVRPGDLVKITAVQEGAKLIAKTITAVAPE